MTIKMATNSAAVLLTSSHHVESLHSESSHTETPKNILDACDVLG